jgi:5'-nucleotidase
MIILLTNDDGIESPGLWILKEYLQKEHEVWITAPDRERSGTSHSITLKKAVCYKEKEKRVFSCDGTPADCILYSLLGALPVKPDVIVSGINIGPNLGTDIIYSGTAAAARQGAIMNIPSVAVSLDAHRKPFHFENAARFISMNLLELHEKWTPDYFFNVNVPNSPQTSGRWCFTFPARRKYNDRLVCFKSPENDFYYFMEGQPVETEAEEGSDWTALKSGNISVSPVFLHPLNHADEKKLANIIFKA